jgi:hypothetical protein
LLLDNLMARAQSDARYGRAYRLAFDAYCMQHPDEFCVSPKSYAAHLMGLCHGLERAEWPQSYWQIPRWLNGSRNLQKPVVLSARGVMTIADVAGAVTPEEHARQVRAWAECVWRAYESQHALARGWLQKALGE